jgi:hypothetical protein
MQVLFFYRTTGSFGPTIYENERGMYALSNTAVPTEDEYDEQTNDSFSLKSAIIEPKSVISLQLRKRAHCFTSVF